MYWISCDGNIFFFLQILVSVTWSVYLEKAGYQRQKWNNHSGKQTHFILLLSTFLKCHFYFDKNSSCWCPMILRASRFPKRKRRGGQNHFWVHRFTLKMETQLGLRYFSKPDSEKSNVEPLSSCFNVFLLFPPQNVLIDINREFVTPEDKLDQQRMREQAEQHSKGWDSCTFQNKIPSLEC